MLIPESSPEIRDVPDALPVLGDFRVLRAREDLLVQCVGDNLPHGMAGLPAFENLLSVQIESALIGRLRGYLIPTAKDSIRRN